MPSLDPTKTSTLRRRYAQAMNRRFRRLAQDVRTSLVTNHALSANNAARRGLFDFPTSREKVAAFERWLQQQISSGILEVVIRRVGGSTISRHWQNAFIRGAYIRAVSDTEKSLDQLDALASPVGDISVAIETGAHAETLTLMYSRAFEGLRGITEAMSSQLSQIFSQALIEGVGPREIARRITQQISSISKTRAMVLARTETIRTYAEARLNTLEANGVEGVEADVEFLTAGDSRVCRRCLALEGKIYTIQQARGLIPVHPRCRCSWTPANIGESDRSISERKERRRKARQRLAELEGNAQHATAA